MADKKEPPKTSSGSKVTKVKGQVDLETLWHRLYVAHELAITEDLSTMFGRKSDADNRDSKVATIYWDIFRKNIAMQPPMLDIAFEVLQEIKRGLEIVMTPNIKTLRQQVRECLDLETIKKEALEGVIDVKYYATFVISVMAKICAPVRDRDVRRLLDITDTTDLLRGIVEVLGMMKNDLLNYSLSSIKPGIMANHLEYERMTFASYLLAVGGHLPKTERWLKRHVDFNKPPKHMVCKGYLEFLQSENLEQLPETLYLDIERLLRLRKEYYQLVMSCALLHTCIAVVPPLLLKPAFKASFKEFISILICEVKNDEDTTKYCYHISLELNRRLNKLIEEGSEDTKTVKRIYIESGKLAVPAAKEIEDIINKAAKPNHPVRELVTKRLNHHLTESLEFDDNELFGTIPEAFDLHKEELKSLNDFYRKIFLHNIDICFSYYSRVIESYDNESVDLSIN